MQGRHNSSLVARPRVGRARRLDRGCRRLNCRRIFVITRRESMPHTECERAIVQGLFSEELGDMTRKRIQKLLALGQHCVDMLVRTMIDSIAHDFNGFGTGMGP